jgi:uncharacterized protein
MRNPPNDPGLTLDNPATTLGAAHKKAAPERRCILTGAHDERGALIRLAISPDGAVVPDIMARAPGRGAWIGVDRAELETALAKGKLKGALARGFKGAALTLADDLPQQIDDGFRRALTGQLGMAAKAGVLLAGADKIDATARAGQVRLLLHAADAAADGRRKRDQSWRVGEDAEGSGQAGLVLPLSRDVLGQALGRENAVHLAIIDAGWAHRIGNLLTRWHRYAGWSTGGAIVASDGTG